MCHRTQMPFTFVILFLDIRQCFQTNYSIPYYYIIYHQIEYIVTRTFYIGWKTFYRLQIPDNNISVAIFRPLLQMLLKLFFIIPFCTAYSYQSTMYYSNRDSSSFRISARKLFFILCLFFNFVCDFATFISIFYFLLMVNFTLCFMGILCWKTY